MITGLSGIQGLAGLGGAERTGASTKTAATGDGFGTVLGDMIDNSVSRLEHAEHLSAQALQGKADTRAVVDAVMNAEQTLQAAIAIRDKIVSAYLDISRMAI